MRRGGIERHPFGQQDARGLQLRRVEVGGVGVVREHQFGGCAIGQIGLRRFRRERERRREGDQREGGQAVAAFGAHGHGVGTRGVCPFVGFTAPAGGARGPGAQAAAGVAHEGAVFERTVVAKEGEARFEQAGRDVVNFEEVVIVARPFDVPLDEGVHEDSRANLQRHAEVRGHAGGLFEVVDLPRERHIREYTRSDFEHRRDFVLADHRAPSAAFGTFGRGKEMLHRFHFGGGELFHRALRHGLGVRAHPRRHVDAKVLEVAFGRGRGKGHRLDLPALELEVGDTKGRMPRCLRVGLCFRVRLFFRRRRGLVAGFDLAVGREEAFQPEFRRGLSGGCEDGHRRTNHQREERNASGGPHYQPPYWTGGLYPLFESSNRCNRSVTTAGASAQR